MISLATGLSMAKTAYDLWKGKDEQTVEGVIIQAATKGLKKSKTALAAHGQLVASLLLIMGINPNTTWTIILVAAAFLVYAKDIILRAVTRGPV